MPGVADANRASHTRECLAGAGSRARFIDSTLKADREITNENTTYDLDKKFEEDIDKTNGITAEMVKVMLDYSILWENEMEQYYILSNEKMDEGRMM